MCGIAGILAGPQVGPPSLEDLRRMAAMLRHRGPDGYGLFRDDRVGLAHTRLSIIDLAGGFQPLHNEDKTVWLAFNGEVFGYPDWRRRLEGLGHRFYTQTDTEVVVHAFEQYGEQAWRMLNGQFAIALWDARTRHLWLVRDRVGILPLHYACTGARLLFGSEVKAILATGEVAARLDSAALGQAFVQWAVAAPATLFEHVRSVPPATAMCFDENLRGRESRYWQPDLAEAADLQDITADAAADALGERLSRAIDLRLRADVPVGAYLSGGLDSSTICHLVRRADSSPLQTFAVRFKDPAFDESAAQRRMAALLGTAHHEVLCGAEEISSALPDVVWHCETPLLRTAPAPLFLLSQLVRRHGMKVVLTGEGADELIAGYDIFKEDRVRRFWARQPESTRRPLLLSRLYRDVAPNSAKPNPLWQKFFARGLAGIEDPFYSHRLRWANGIWTLRFLSADVQGATDPDRLAAETAALLPSEWRRWPPLARAQMIEIHTFLSAYLLSCQGDRMAMGHSVEVRYPFLDPDVFDFCARLPQRLKMRGLRDKVVLRRLASRFLPPEIWNRPKKAYRAPMAPALFGTGAAEYVTELLSDASLSRFGLVDVPTASRLVAKAKRQAGRMSGEREEMALVGLLTLQLLAQQYLADFPSRARTAREALDRDRLCVLEDCVSSPVRRHT